MALVFSTNLRNFVADYGSWTHAFNNGMIEIYSGAQPSTTTADLAPTGNLLCTLTKSSGARTAEVLAIGYSHPEHRRSWLCRYADRQRF